MWMALPPGSAAPAAPLMHQDVSSTTATNPQVWATARPVHRPVRHAQLAAALLERH